MAVDTRGEVIGAYRSRRTVLLHEAAQAERERRVELAKAKRAAADILSHAISDEIIDDKPTGLGTFGPVASHDDDVREGWER